MEASETKWVNPILNIIRINSLRLRGLHMVLAELCQCISWNFSHLKINFSKTIWNLKMKTNLRKFYIRTYTLFLFIFIANRHTHTYIYFDLYYIVNLTIYVICILSYDVKIIFRISQLAIIHQYFSIFEHSNGYSSITIKDIYVLI